MFNPCENCKLFMIMDDNRIEWYNNLSKRNIEMHKKIMEQQDVITLLRQQLLQKQSGYLARILNDALQNRDNFQEQSKMQDRIEAISELINTLNMKIQSFQQYIDDNEQQYSKHISYLNGLVDYYRESLFTELKKCSKLKRRFFCEIDNIATTSETVVFDKLKIEEEKINGELRSRYKQALQKNKEEIQAQNQLIGKLRKHNRQIYSVMHANKKDYEEHQSNSERKIADLKSLVKRLRDKIDCLQTQIKLEVEGCHHDILDARKRIKTLTKV